MQRQPPSAPLSDVHEYFRSELGVQMALSDQMVRYYWDRDPARRATVLSIMIEGLSKPTVSLDYPRDWWQALKDKWLPRWVKRVWLVEMEHWEVARFCPHKVVTNTMEPHMEFLDLGDVTEVRADG